MGKLIGALILTALTWSTAALGDDIRYQTFCRIEDGQAKGYIKLIAPSSHSFSGKAWFYIYDRDGDLIDQDWETVVAVVVGDDLELVEETDVDDDAYGCYFDLSEILGPPDDPGPPPNPDYFTTCEIRDGKAYGYIQLRESGSLSFSGKVWFYIYDDDGDLIDKDWEIAVVIVVGTDREPVEETDVDDDAYSCYLDVSEAID